MAFVVEANAENLARAGHAGRELHSLFRQQDRRSSQQPAQQSQRFIAVPDYFLHICRSLDSRLFSRCLDVNDAFRRLHAKLDSAIASILQQLHFMGPFFPVIRLAFRHALLASAICG
ncbi:hypothetical protein D3C71_1455870 [compost metagenome]